MDICLWYAKCKEEMKQTGYQPKWGRKDTPVNKKIETELRHEKFEYEGIVKKKGTKVFYCGNYLLEHPKDNEFKEGHRIQIKSSIAARESFMNGDGEDVDRFAFLCNIKKL